jgi:hypothetical protein
VRTTHAVTAVPSKAQRAAEAELLGKRLAELVCTPGHVLASMCEGVARLLDRRRAIAEYTGDGSETWVCPWPRVALPDAFGVGYAESPPAWSTSSSRSRWQRRP